MQFFNFDFNFKMFNIKIEYKLQKIKIVLFLVINFKYNPQINYLFSLIYLLALKGI